MRAEEFYQQKPVYTDKGVYITGYKWAYSDKAFEWQPLYKKKNILIRLMQYLKGDN